MEGIGILLLALSALTATVLASRTTRHRLHHIDDAVKTVEAQHNSFARLERSVEEYGRTTDRALEEIAKYVSDDPSRDDNDDPPPPLASNAARELIESHEQKRRLIVSDVLSVVEKQNTYEVVRELVHASSYTCGWQGVSVARLALMVSGLAATVPAWSGDVRARAIRRLSDEITHVSIGSYCSLAKEAASVAKVARDIESEGRDAKPVIWAFLRVGSGRSIPSSPDVRPVPSRPSTSDEIRAIGFDWSERLALAERAGAREISGSRSNRPSRSWRRADDETEAMCVGS